MNKMDLYWLVREKSKEVLPEGEKPKGEEGIVNKKIDELLSLSNYAKREGNEEKSEQYLQTAMEWLYAKKDILNLMAGKSKDLSKKTKSLLHEYLPEKEQLPIEEEKEKAGLPQEHIEPPKKPWEELPTELKTPDLPIPAWLEEERKQRKKEREEQQKRRERNVVWKEDETDLEYEPIDLTAKSIKTLIKIANDLDAKGKISEADKIDAVIENLRKRVFKEAESWKSPLFKELADKSDE